MLVAGIVTHPCSRSSHNPLACVVDDKPWREPWREELYDQLQHELDWSHVNEAISRAVSSGVALPGDLQPAPTSPLPPPRPRHAHEPPRHTWALRIAYYGPSYCGFAWQPSGISVSGCVEAAIASLLGERTVLACAGRTDAGVSAIGQLVTFSTFNPTLSFEALSHAVAAAAPSVGTLRLVTAQTVPRSFHATFSTAWRKYVYLLPANDATLGVDAVAIDRQLRPLVDAGEAHYGALGRGLPRGKSPRMRLQHASARAVQLEGGARAIRFELVGDRFLRRQVRTLVATAVHAARECESGDAMGEVEGGGTKGRRGEHSHAKECGSGDAMGEVEVSDGEAPRSTLLRMATSGRQELTAHPAPPTGLVFADSGILEAG